MKLKHNKKRNTAFVYEALVREATSAALKQNVKMTKKINFLVRKHFAKDTLLRRDLECYRSLYKGQNLSAPICDKILREAKLVKIMIDGGALFQEQSVAIKNINKEISSSVFNNYVPNYKSLATIAQIFSSKTDPRSRVILESKILDDMSSEGPPDSSEVIDDLTYKTFVEKFNVKYDTTLLAEQKKLLSLYIGSFSDNGVGLKIYLNEEISRLRQGMTDLQASKDIQNDPEMEKKVTQIMEALDSFKQAKFDDKTLLKIMKVQKLVKETGSHGDND